jgi:hypothetical protein
VKRLVFGLAIAVAMALVAGLERLQGEGCERVERTIDVHVRNLRSKLEPDTARPRYVQTVFGIGYRFQTNGRSATEG